MTRGQRCVTRGQRCATSCLHCAKSPCVGFFPDCPADFQHFPAIFREICDFPMISEISTDFAWEITIFCKIPGNVTAGPHRAARRPPNTAISYCFWRGRLRARAAWGTPLLVKSAIPRENERISDSVAPWRPQGVQKQQQVSTFLATLR